MKRNFGVGRASMDETVINLGDQVSGKAHTDDCPCSFCRGLSSPNEIDASARGERQTHCVADELRASERDFMIVQDDHCSPPRLERRPSPVNAIVACAMTARETQPRKKT